MTESASSHYLDQRHPVRSLIQTSMSVPIASCCNHHGTIDHSNEESMLSSNTSLIKQIESQRIRSREITNVPSFYQNLERALDVRRATQSLFPIVLNNWQTKNAVDFCSNDYLSWNTTGLIRSSLLEELSRYPDFSVASGGSRVMEGNYPYIEETELEIASYHGAEDGLIVDSAFNANVMVWSALPRPGDAIVYDAFVHASTHEGMERSLALQRTEFQHNNVKAFHKTLTSILDSQPMIKQGRRSILVAVESVYSMEGDVCPLLELVEVADEISQGLGNIQFIVDETHSAGLIGPNGTGLVCELGLEAEIAVRLHTYSKAMGACGGRHSSSLPRLELIERLRHHTRQRHDQIRTYQFRALQYLFRVATVSICGSDPGWA